MSLHQQGKFVVTIFNTCCNKPFTYPTGEGPRSEGRERPVGPVRAGDAAARQEAPTRDQDQEAHTQPQVERDILL